MKIVIVNASPRKTGATAKILNEFENQLKLCGDIDTALFHLSDLRIEYCKGCCRCYQTGQCFLKDDAEMLSQMIAEADGLIIGSPNYVSGVPGQLKTFVDRGHFVIEQLLKDVYTMSIVTYENADGNAVIKFLNKLFIMSGARNAGKMMIKLPFNTDPLDNCQVQRKIAKQSRRFYNVIQNQPAAGILNRLIHAAAFRFVIIPFVLKKGKTYQGVLQHWKKRGISYEIV